MEWLRSLIVKKLLRPGDIEDALKNIKDKAEKHRILTLAVKRLYNTIGHDDILQPADDGMWICQGKKLEPYKVGSLITEAKNFEMSDLWKVLQLDIKYQSNKKMYISSKNEDDMIAGKMWLFTLDTLRTRLKSLTEESAFFNNKK